MPELREKAFVVLTSVGAFQSLTVPRVATVTDADKKRCSRCRDRLYCSPECRFGFWVPSVSTMLILGRTGQKIYWRKHQPKCHRIEDPLGDFFL